MNKLKVFILSAGFGERLRPITDHIPKPLLPVLGKPVLEYVLERMSTLPVQRIGINTHHKKDAVEGWIKGSPFNEMVKLFHEETILGTGGALKNAETFLINSKSFLVHNADILSDIDLERLIESHLSSKNIATLAVHDCPEFNNLIVDKRGLLKGIKSQDSRLDPLVVALAFTGVAVYSSEFLKFLLAGVSSVVDAWLNVISSGFTIETLNVSGCYWRDIGTPSAYASAVFDKLRADGETIYIHHSLKECRDVTLNGYVVIEKGSMLDEGVSLRNCIILPDSNIKGDLHYENSIIGHGFKIDISESGKPCISEDGSPVLIGTGGSDRKYYRVKNDKKLSVLMQCNGDESDFNRQIEYTRFFTKYSIPVPELIGIEPDRMSAVFEDMGDTSLYTWLKCPRKEKQIEEIYRQVIDVMVAMHTTATEHVSECPLLEGRVFDYEHFRWETDYFIEIFVKGVRNINIKNYLDLNNEFHMLALRADSFPKTVIHRDFQSQNIMITKKCPRLIDYQGARMGPPGYDVVSLLWDPYYHLNSDMRERLVIYYINRVNPVRNSSGALNPAAEQEGIISNGVKDRAGNKFNEKIFKESLMPCRLQRHMQALGAYGFLSTIKGKKYFLKYIPEGLRLLKEDLTLSENEYPELYNLVMKL